MVINDAMRKYARTVLGVPADANDEAVSKALGVALMEDKISAATWSQLRDNKAVDGRALIESIVGEQLKPFREELLSAIKGITPGTAVAPTPATVAVGGQQVAGGVIVPVATNPGNNPNPAPGGGVSGSPPTLTAEVQTAVKHVLSGMGISVPDNGGRVTPHQLLSRTASAGLLADPSSIRVKSPIENFSNVRGEARWPGNHKHAELRNVRCTYPSEGGPGMGRPLDMPSQADYALIGTYFKWCANMSWSGGEMPSKYRMNDLDWELVKYMVHELPWTGYIGGDPIESPGATPIDGMKLSGVWHKGMDGIKAILDDSTSGGIQAAPVLIEDALILQPLLYGELFPLVTVINVARGRRIHQPTIGRPTFTSGIPEGTPIPLFDTTNFLGTLDSSIFTAVGSMEIGLDLEEDSPSNIGQTVVMSYGEAALEWLDRVIALGDGVAEPLGIFNTAGLTLVSSANGAAGPLTVADAEALMFGINKAYRGARGGRNVFIGNEVSYRRFRSIPMGAAWANSRAFGPDYNNYQVLNNPYRVIPLVPANWIAYANLGFYRMWRRLGMTVKVETGGKTLSLANTKLIVVRMRYGGLPEQGGAFAVMVDAPL